MMTFQKMGMTNGYHILSCLALLLFLGIPEWGHAQKMNFKSYSVSDGLPQAQVHDIAQTNDGYIWIATYGGGLSRFDGQEFVNYTTEDGLKDNAVENILVDSNDQVWISTETGGVATFQGDSLVYPIKDDTLNSYDFTGMGELRDGRKLFGAYQGGVFIYDGTQLQSRLTTADGLPSNNVWEFFEDDDGRLWMGTDEGVSVYDGAGFTNYTSQDGLSSNIVFEIIEDQNDNKWFATGNGLSVWDGENFQSIQTVEGEPLGAVYDILEASDGRMWIATETNGIYVREGDGFTHFTTANGLNSNYIYNLHEDQDNNIWIGTDEDGLNIYKDYGFTLFGNNTGLSSNGILSLHRDSNNVLWFGTVDGMESYDGQRFRKYQLPKEYENNNIWNITSLPNGDKLVGMPDNSLMRFDGNSFTNFSESYGLGSLFVYDMYLESEEVLWIATANGLYRISLETKDVEHYTSEDGLGHDRVFHIYEDQEGTKWIGTNYGLTIFDGEQFKNITVSEGLGNNMIYYITQDDRGNLWIGTGGGVTLYKPSQGGGSAEIHNFDKSDGMLLVTTHFIWFDEEGYLWQGTNGGLQMLDVPTFRKTGNMYVTHFPLSSSGIGLEFNFHALEANRGEVWMGSMQGALRLDPNNLTRNTPPPPLYLTEVRMNAVPIDWEQYTDSVSYHNGQVNFPTITLPFGENTYGFSFQGLSYIHPGNVTYRYKLEGFDDNWRPETKDNSAVYTNLSPGDYTFVAEAKNGGGQFSDKQITYSFSVAYPFWRTYWFYTLAMVSVLGLIYGLTQYRVNKLEKEKLQQLVDEQTRHLTEALEEKEVLIKEIHHRVKNNLAVISGLLELQIGYSDNNFVHRVLSESQRRIQSISMIHEKLYQNKRLAEINFEKYVGELIDIIAYSFNYANKEIDVNIEIDDFKLGVDQGIPCGLILNELVSNAYEHAFKEQQQGMIDVKITQNKQQKITLVVADDGCGLGNDFDITENETLGLTLVETLCNQLEGDFRFENANPGSRFVLEFQREEAPLNVPA